MCLEKCLIPINTVFSVEKRRRIDDISLPGRIQELRGGAQTLFKKKSGGAWAPTHSQAPCRCKNKGRPCLCKIRGARAVGAPPPPQLNPPLHPWRKMGYRHVRPWRPPFHPLLAFRKTHQFSIFSSQDPILSPLNHKFLEILYFWAPNTQN